MVTAGTSKIPPVSLYITTYEYYNNQWNATLTHTFYGETEEEARKVVDAHRKTDSFFNGSFLGRWNGIILKNSEPQIQHNNGNR